MVVGGGGAARSAIYAMWKWFSPSEIYIANRLRSEVDEMVDFFAASLPGMKLRYFGCGGCRGTSYPVYYCGHDS